MIPIYIEQKRTNIRSGQKSYNVHAPLSTCLWVVVKYMKPDLVVACFIPPYLWPGYSYNSLGQM